MLELELDDEPLLDELADEPPLEELDDSPDEPDPDDSLVPETAPSSSAFAQLDGMSTKATAKTNATKTLGTKTQKLAGLADPTLLTEAPT